MNAAEAQLEVASHLAEAQLQLARAVVSLAFYEGWGRAVKGYHRDH
jgi:hypothetical protein